MLLIEPILVMQPLLCEHLLVMVALSDSYTIVVETYLYLNPELAIAALAVGSALPLVDLGVWTLACLRASPLLASWWPPCRSSLLDNPYRRALPCPCSEDRLLHPRGEFTELAG